jgi:putative holliday junction resolvase
MNDAAGRVLAFDFGKRRIGLAISDPLGITAQGLPTFERKRLREDLAKLAKLARDMKVGLFLFGNPKYMSGDESQQSAQVKEFAERLGELAAIPVLYWDERFTSAQAHRLLGEEGMKRENRKGKVDQIAATLILQDYLESLDLQ